MAGCSLKSSRNPIFGSIKRSKQWCFWSESTGVLQQVDSLDHINARSEWQNIIKYSCMSFSNKCILWYQNYIIINKKNSLMVVDYLSRWSEELSRIVTFSLLGTNYESNQQLMWSVLQHTPPTLNQILQYVFLLVLNQVNLNFLKSIHVLAHELESIFKQNRNKAPIYGLMKNRCDNFGPRLDLCIKKELCIQKHINFSNVVC